MADKESEAACKRCGKPTKGKLDGVALCDECYSVFGACCASEFEDDDVLSKTTPKQDDKGQT
ncbi:MAG: hypothetical protein ACSHX8_08915 [Opitutaceae bacterium]